jgi:hypothetical protein
MLRAETILRTCIEAAEIEYLRAKEAGVAAPVIELVCFDPKNPHTVGLAVWDRPQLARSMGQRSIKAAAALREPPPNGCPFTIVVANWDSVQIFHCPEPGLV